MNTTTKAMLKWVQHHNVRIVGTVPPDDRTVDATIVHASYRQDWQAEGVRHVPCVYVTWGAASMDLVNTEDPVNCIGCLAEALA